MVEASQASVSSARSVLDRGQSLVLDLGGLDLRGPSGAVWGLDSPQLNANLVTLRAGESMDAHVNDEVDVLVVIRAGSGCLDIEDLSYEVNTDTVALVPRGVSRAVHATTALTYVTVHARRAGLGLGATPAK